MWSNERGARVMVLLSGVLVGPACAATPAHTHKAVAAGVPTCAATHAGEGLSRVSVFDGPPAEMADLVPDNEKTVRGATVSSWDVSSVYRAGRIVHASCRYGKGAPVVVALTTPVRVCRLTEAVGKRTLTCR
jgi:hypothetical protein